MRVRVHAEVETDVAAETIRKALLDFSDRRLEIWSKTLDPKSYEVHEIGDTWAVVKEGNRFPKLWSRERYDWSTPNTISWISQDSDFCTPGSGITMVITPDDGGGSHVAVTWDRTSKNLKGWLWLLGPRIGGERMLRWATKQALRSAAKAVPPS
jgi:hypothetical protein